MLMGLLFVFVGVGNNLFKSGVSMMFSSKVNDSLLTGVKMIDMLIAVGKGQSQLILGDSFSGKTSLFVFNVVTLGLYSGLGVVFSFGLKSLLGLYVGLNMTFVKVLKLFVDMSLVDWFVIMFVTHASTVALLSLVLPLLGLTLSERFMDKGLDMLVCLDDVSSHAKSYSQVSLLLDKIPSSDAFPADMFNVHSSLLERCSKLNCLFLVGSVSSLPVMETINSDVTEFMATNLISITDGQYYLSSKLFMSVVSPAMDTGLSVSSMGSGAQSSFVKFVGLGVKNELTYLSYLSEETVGVVSVKSKLKGLEVLFMQRYLDLVLLEGSLLLLCSYRFGLGVKGFVCSKDFV